MTAHDRERAEAGAPRAAGATPAFAAADPAAGVSSTLDARAREVLGAQGFSRVGFARVDGPEERAARLGAWLDRGHAGAMDYIARNAARRADPRLVLAGCRSVIVVSVRYDAPRPLTVARPDSDAAEIAAYARGSDYHRVLGRRLRRVRDALTAELGGTFRYYVDDGPVLEKWWAARAGIGWIGKHTCVIDGHAGSWSFLGVLLTTLELTPDPPAIDHCGNCRACLDACPTGAFPEPYVLDSRRCISYLTIEERGEWPAALEESSGRLVFGCDICQAVCPFNREVRTDGDPELAPRPENVRPSIAELASLDEASFRTRFASSPVLRAKARGLLRNVIIALANSADPRHREILDRMAARDDVRGDPVLRATLERACKRLGSPL